MYVLIPEYQKLKVEEHLRTCSKGTFKIFPLLQMRSSEIDLRRSYERNYSLRHFQYLTSYKSSNTRSILVELVI